MAKGERNSSATTDLRSSLPSVYEAKYERGHRDQVAYRRLRLRNDDPIACQLVEAIETGDLAGLRRLLADNRATVVAKLQHANGSYRTPLHVAADWPGHFPNGAAVVAALIEFGADPNAICEGWHAETPLHFAASTDDVEVLDALIDGGAELETRGASVAGGTALDNAVGYGCWLVAHRLVHRGARAKKLWHAAGLGMTSSVEEFLARIPPPTPNDVNEAFWYACRGAQRRTAEYLIARGADLNWIPPYHPGTGLDIAGAADSRRQILVDWLRARGAKAAADQA